MSDKEIEKMSFEDALSELEQIVKSLEMGQETLDNAINNYERGSALKLHCEKKLTEAKMRVEKIVQQSNGEITTEPFTVE